MVDSLVKFEASLSIEENLCRDIAALADEAATTTLSDVGGYAILADHASILHETLETRIYRT